MKPLAHFPPQEEFRKRRHNYRPCPICVELMGLIKNAKSEAKKKSYRMKLYFHRQQSPGCNL